MRTGVTTALLLLSLGVPHAVRGDGKYWWMGNGAFGGGNNIDNGGNQQKVNRQPAVGQSGSGSCPPGLTCLPPAECWTPPAGTLQPRVSNFYSCGGNNVCCSSTDNSNDDSPAGVSENVSAPARVSENLVEAEQTELLQTECPLGMMCVGDNFCDANTEVSDVLLALSKADKDKRGKLIPCMNPVSGTFDVCCNKVETAALTAGGSLLPATQGLATLARQGTCPAVNTIPPVEQCAGRASNCWSPGQPDVDCVGDALCCFDGCANVCLGGGGSITPVQPPNPRPQQQGQARPQQPQPQPAKKPAQPPKQYPQQQYPQQQPPQQFIPQPAPAQPQPAFQQQPQPAFQQQPRPVQQPTFQQQPARPSAPAETKPYVSCPSAMKCVPRENCDFNGVMTNDVLDLTPDLEMLRVPLIPCVNRMRGNAIDVCCRDPNYQDPWPDMNGGGDQDQGGFNAQKAAAPTNVGNGGAAVRPNGAKKGSNGYGRK